MFVRTVKLAAVTLALCVLSGHSGPLVAQQAGGKPAPQQAPARPAAGADDAARKAEILASPQWRRAMFEFKEWLSAQQIYDAKQVDAMKARFNERVAAMSAVELENLLADMQAKFQILNSPQAQEARAWMASYLSVMSDKMRAEVLKDIPNVATMTAAQLQREVMKIEQKRAAIDREQATFQRTQQQLATAQLQRDRQAQQTYVRERDRFPTTTYSPYHSGSDVNARLNAGRVGSGMSYSVGPYGGVWANFSSASF
jgi:hypothetical protein